MGFFDPTKVYIIVGITQDGKPWFGDVYITKERANWDCLVMNSDNPKGHYHVMERKVADAG